MKNCKQEKLSLNGKVERPCPNWRKYIYNSSKEFLSGSWMFFMVDETGTIHIGPM